MPRIVSQSERRHRCPSPPLADWRPHQQWLIDSPLETELFGALGITNIRTFVDPQNPKRVALMMDVPDMDKLSAMMQSKAAADAMAFDGVVPESLVILVESKG